MSSEDDALARYLDAHPDLKAKVEDFAKHVRPRSPLDPPPPPITVDDIADERGRLTDDEMKRIYADAPTVPLHGENWVTINGRGVSRQEMDAATHYTLAADGVWICNRCREHIWDPGLHETHVHSAPNSYRVSGFGMAPGRVFGGTTAHSPVGAFVVDEAHTHTVDPDRPGPWSLPELAAFARESEVPTFIDGVAATDWILAETKRRADAEHAAREAQCEEWLKTKVSERIRLLLEGHRAFPLGDEYAKEHAISVATLAAVEAFLEFLREPPTIVQHADGITEIREPAACGCSCIHCTEGDHPVSCRCRGE